MQLFQAFTKIILLISLSVWLSACGGGGSSDVPTDTSLVFSVFPPGYFDGSYSDLYSLTGSSSDDENFNATLRKQSGSTVLFNGHPVMTINQEIWITNILMFVVGSGTLRDTGSYRTEIQKYWWKREELARAFS